MDDYFADAPIISTYTRAQAIEDGVLVDVSAMAKEAGFRYPVAVTRAVYDEYVNPKPMPKTNDERGRLWDLLTILRIKCRTEASPCMEFSVLFKVMDGAVARLRKVALKAIIDGGDDGEPVITVLLPDED